MEEIAGRGRNLGNIGLASYKRTKHKPLLKPLSPSAKIKIKIKIKQIAELEEEERIASLIRKCGNTRILRQTHAAIITRLFPASAVSYLLSKVLAFTALSASADINYARKVFNQIPGPSVFAYNSLIRGISSSKKPSKEPIYLLKRMVKKGYPNPDSFTMAFVLKACSALSAFEEGEQVHGRVLRSGFGLNPFVQTSLLNFYAKCEEVSLARKVFDEIPDRNLVTWSAMISGYARVGWVNEALGMFREMQQMGVEPDEMSFISVISACAIAGALYAGIWVHACIKRRMININLQLGTALVNMYAKCGCLEKAKETFDSMSVKDTKAWNSMIVGFAIHGHGKDALQAFSLMQEAKVKPDHVTFAGIFSACAHSGLVSEGQRYWSNMLDLGIDPSMEHYGFMVDLLRRGALVDKAYNFVETMPVAPDPMILQTLLLGCKKNDMLQQAEIVADRLLQFEPLNAENYIILANMYASTSQWEKMSHVRTTLKEKGTKGVPGCTFIEVDGFVHKFVMGDRSHSEAQEIKQVLKDISVRIDSSWYRAHLSAVLPNVGDEDKEDALYEHSERLAIAYGLLRTKSPAAIRIVNNLRVCDDCHEVMKKISKIYERKIIVRDRVRFHKFVDGTCTCNDIW